MHRDRDNDEHRPRAGGVATPHAVVRGALAEAQARLRGVALRRLDGDRHAAEDVLQRFAVRALERAGELRDPERVHGWLTRVFASTLADHGRRLARRREYPGDPHEIARTAIAPEPEPAAWACDCIEPLLEALRPDQAALIRRLDLAGESRERLAAELGVLPNALHVRHHRARRALAASLLATCVVCPIASFMSCACPKPPAVDAERARGIQWADAAAATSRLPCVVSAGRGRRSQDRAGA